MMKNKRNIIRLTVAVVCIAVVMLGVGTSAFADNTPSVAVLVNGKQIEFDVEPIIEDGRTLVPMRFIFEALQAKVDWIADTRTAVAYKDGIKIEISIDNKTMLKNGKSIELDVPARLTDGRTLVPVRAVSEGLGAKVEWEPDSYRVIITSTESGSTQTNGNYHYTALSPADQKLLHSACGEMRYAFEQVAIPQLVLSYPKKTAEVIESGDTSFAEAICAEWDKKLVSIIIRIQLESESHYDVSLQNPQNENEMKNAYENMLKELGYSASQNVEFSFVSTPNGKKVMLGEFKNIMKDEANPILITSKYIAAATENGKVKYFTLEYSPLSDVYMFCEVGLENRTNHGQMPDVLDDFLTGIDDVF